MSKLVTFLRRHKKAEVDIAEGAATTAGIAILKRVLVAGVAAAAIAVPTLVDLSNNNGPSAVSVISSPGVHAVEAKATEGLGFKDYLYPTFRAAALQYRKPFGGYLFLHPDESGKAQADYFLAYATPQNGDLQPVVDSELGAACASAPQTLAALDELVAKGFKPVLYSNTYWLSQLATCAPALKAFPVWQAQYAAVRQVVPGFHVIAWQYTDAAPVNGHNVDGSHFLVKLATLRIGYNPKPKLTAAEKLAEREAKLHKLTGGFWRWRAWRLGVSKWHGLAPADPLARPQVPHRISHKWWRHFRHLERG